MTEQPSCRRRGGLISRIVTDRVTTDDRVHAVDCATCGPLLARAARFDDELRRAARGLITDELPRGMLDPGVAPRTVGVVAATRSGPGLLGVLAAVVIFIAATSIAFRPVPLGPSSQDPNATSPTLTLPTYSGPPSTPEATGPLPGLPAFRSTAELGGSLIGLDYLCQSGRARQGTAGLIVRDGIVCYSPKSLTLTSVVVATGETQRGVVAEVRIKGQLVGEDTEDARNQLAETMAKATFLVIVDADEAPRAGDFVLAHVPDLRLGETGATASGAFGDVQLTMQRNADGSYDLVLRSFKPD